MRSFDTTTHPTGRAPLTDTHPTSASVAVLIGPVGRLEGTQSAAFRRRLAALSQVEGAHIAVDLSAVPAMDTATARCLTEAGERLHNTAGRLCVHRTRSQPRAMLRAAGLAADLLTTTPDQARTGDQS